MKKIIRTIITVLMLTVLCFSLSSCKAIDETREIQAKINSDGSVLYNGKTYKKLPKEYLSDNIEYYTTDKTVYITESDVPVLLTYFFGTFAYTDKNETFIRTDSYDNPAFYCREDLYDSVIEEIKNPQYTKYFMTIDTSGLSFFTDTEIPDRIALTEEETAALNEIISAKENIVTEDNGLTDYIFSDIYDEGYSYAEIKRYTEDELFSEDFGMIVRNTGNLYICIYGNDGSEIYKVPEEGDAAEKVKALYAKKLKIDEKLEELFDKIGGSYGIDDEAMLY